MARLAALVLTATVNVIFVWVDAACPLQRALLRWCWEMGGRANPIRGETSHFTQFFSAKICAQVGVGEWKGRHEHRRALKSWIRIDVPRLWEHFQPGCVSYSWYIPAVTEERTITAELMFTLWCNNVQKTHPKRSGVFFPGLKALNKSCIE